MNGYSGYIIFALPILFVALTITCVTVVTINHYRRRNDPQPQVLPPGLRNPLSRRKNEGLTKEQLDEMFPAKPFGVAIKEMIQMGVNHYNKIHDIGLGHKHSESADSIIKPDPSAATVPNTDAPSAQDSATISPSSVPLLNLPQQPEQVLSLRSKSLRSLRKNTPSLPRLFTMPTAQEPAPPQAPLESAATDIYMSELRPTASQSPEELEQTLWKKDCAICQGPIADDDYLDLEHGDRETIMVRLLPCGHVFHDMCISKWMLKKATCPMCARCYKPVEVQEGEEVVPLPHVEEVQQADAEEAQVVQAEEQQQQQQQSNSHSESIIHQDNHQEDGQTEGVFLSPHSQDPSTMV